MHFREANLANSSQSGDECPDGLPHPKMSCKETAYLTGRSSIEGYETRNVAFGFASCNQQSNTVTVSYIVNFIAVISISVKTSLLCQPLRTYRIQYGNPKKHRLSRRHSQLIQWFIGKRLFRDQSLVSGANAGSEVWDERNCGPAKPRRLKARAARTKDCRPRARQEGVLLLARFRRVIPCPMPHSEV
jgi:hypothetical protein